MRLNARYIKNQIMAQQMLQQNSSKTNVKDAAKRPDSLLIQSGGTRDLSQVNYSRSGVTEKGSSLSRLYQSANQKTITDNGNETVIAADNPYESESDIASRILDEKYSRINEINKRKSDPLRFIKDKYQRPDSPYFRSDLTESERQAAYHNETEWLFKGKAQSYDFRDAAFRGETLNGEIQGENEKVFQRGQVNQQIGVLFHRNHIQIPEDANLTFTISPIDYLLKVSGTDDQELTQQIEAVLNSGENSKELFAHIIRSRSDDSSQFTPEAYEKYQVVREMYEVTGYHLKDLQTVGGKFVTEDGRDLLEIYKEALQHDPLLKHTAAEAAAHYGQALTKLARTGYDAIPDLVLSIDYKDGSLRDAGQSRQYGSGDTEWLSEWKRELGVRI
ncbi:DUF4885 domain-containing protein [Bacillus siamensis]|uniref:DUF4885 domain-containing protein n=1 Tax=Bacillus siamensis TaxID=659243 RepID=A0AAI8HRW5_9BACI|nr:MULTISPECIES: DUF4885 family protein [Bacillus]AME06594.1 hypothetical protein AUL54_09610 [Bacillus sp. SDLI1]AUJ79068.1 DUF4885 domain-containing protein [Bacillus siamensis]UUA84477.1 DUF4885 domain-containing protein [Bacillus siamensis]